MTADATMLPESVSAEQSVLGSLLLDLEGRVRDEVFSVLSVDDAEAFVGARHAELYRIIHDLHERGVPVNDIALENELRKRGIFDDIGGIPYLVELSRSVGSYVNGAHDAKVVKEKWLLRRLHVAGREIASSALRPDGESSSILEESEHALTQISEKRTANRTMSIMDVAAAEYEALESGQGAAGGMKTGLAELDDLTGGMMDSDLIVVGARPSTGKTALGCSIADYTARVSRIPTLFLSLEMSVKAIAQRMLSIASGVSLFRLRTGHLSNSERGRVQQAVQAYKDVPLYIDDCLGSSRMMVGELCAIGRRMVKTRGVKLIILDYLQKCHARRSSRDSRQEEISEISDRLKNLARQCNIPVISLAQLNRNVENREGEPLLSDLRESGAIEQDADVVILLHRIKCEDDQGDGSALYAISRVKLIVAKQRNGPIGEVVVGFEKTSAKFVPLADDHINEPDPEELNSRVAEHTQSTFVQEDGIPF